MADLLADDLCEGLFEGLIVVWDSETLSRHGQKMLDDDRMLVGQPASVGIGQHGLNLIEFGLVERGRFRQETNREVVFVGGHTVFGYVSCISILAVVGFGGVLLEIGFVVDAVVVG